MNTIVKLKCLNYKKKENYVIEIVMVVIDDSKLPASFLSSLDKVRRAG